ncbi:MAG: sigma factor-like helix-turn-helix DNA-binding protein [Eubacteriales bacterium]|nr:sigma factor-like helix-turn-helix DNA-binding protein [Eubacteriales bacterium]
MAYNHGREERKWRIWKENEEKILRECGVDESTIEEIRTYDRAEFNSNRRFYRWANDVAEYLEEMADTEPQAEIKTVSDLLDEIENETLYQILITVDRRTLRILLLKMQGYSTREIAEMTVLTEKAVYRRLERLRKKLKPTVYPFGEI